MRQFFTIILLSLAIFSTASAQDIHFSQHWVTPLVINPANAGNLEGTYRAAGIYRSQWGSVDSPFKTVSASYDMNFDMGFSRGDMLAAGIVLFNDNAGDADFTTNALKLAVAYHKAIGSGSRLSLGLTAGYVQKKLDVLELQFADQYVNGQISGIPSQEIPALMGNDNFNNIDLGLGLMYSTVVSQGFTANGGIGIYHLTQPEESFIGTDAQLGSRLVVHAGGQYELNPTIALHPSILYQTQQKAQEFKVGTNVGYKLDNPNFPATVYGGLHGRMNPNAPGQSLHFDAVVPYAGIEYKNILLGLSYDVNVSSLTTASNMRGGFEISLMYLGIIESPPTTIVVPCIRF